MGHPRLVNGGLGIVNSGFPIYRFRGAVLAKANPPFGTYDVQHLQFCNGARCRFAVLLADYCLCRFVLRIVRAVFGPEDVRPIVVIYGNAGYVGFQSVSNHGGYFVTMFRTVGASNLLVRFHFGTIPFGFSSLYAQIRAALRASHDDDDRFASWQAVHDFLRRCLFFHRCRIFVDPERLIFRCGLRFRGMLHVFFGHDAVVKGESLRPLTKDRVSIFLRDYLGDLTILVGKPRRVMIIHRVLRVVLVRSLGSALLGVSDFRSSVLVCFSRFVVLEFQFRVSRRSSIRCGLPVVKDVTRIASVDRVAHAHFQVMVVRKLICPVPCDATARRINELRDFPVVGGVATDVSR